MSVRLAVSKSWGLKIAEMNKEPWVQSGQGKKKVKKVAQRGIESRRGSMDRTETVEDEVDLVDPSLWVK